MEIKEYLKNTAKYNKNTEMLEVRKFLECNDGFKISVQASELHYCTPRKDLFDGEYYTIELGFPNQEDELIKEYAESNYYTETVYGYVPIEIVEKLIKKHNGIKGDK